MVEGREGHRDSSLFKHKDELDTSPGGARFTVIISPGAGKREKYLIPKQLFTVFVGKFHDRLPMPKVTVGNVVQQPKYRMVFALASFAN
jgi:hypothetical protein